MGCICSKSEDDSVDDHYQRQVGSDNSRRVREDTRPRICTVDVNDYRDRVQQVGGDGFNESFHRRNTNHTPHIQAATSNQPSRRSLDKCQSQQNRSNDNNQQQSIVRTVNTIQENVNNRTPCRGIVNNRDTMSVPGSSSGMNCDVRTGLSSDNNRILNRNKSKSSYFNALQTDSSDLTNGNRNVQVFSGADRLSNILSFPLEWCSQNVNKIDYVDIPLNSSVGISVQKLFQKTSCTKKFILHLNYITRIENKFLYTMYLLKKQEMEFRNGYADELFLYHGTKSINLQSICENNLDWRNFSYKHKFGQGISFSPFANYSSHYCDESETKVILLCKVLISNVITGTLNMIIPPIKDGTTYDTSVKGDLNVIVKYCDNEHYPLYIITCRKITLSN